MRKNRVERICQNCGETFLIYPSYLKASPGAGRWCSMACRNGAGGWKPQPPRTITATNDELRLAYESGITMSALAEQYNVTLSAISWHLRRLGVVTRPNDGAMLRHPDARAKAAAAHPHGAAHPGYHPVPIDDLIAAYRDGFSTEQLAKQYGISAATVARKLRAAGIQVRRPGFSRFRRCKDGHAVQSRWEQAVDDWLYAHEIPHEIHPFVPWYRGGKSPQRADFRSGDIYIEVWGVNGNARYDARRLDKLEHYRACNTQLIELFPHHIQDSDYSPLHCLLPT